MKNLLITILILLSFSFGSTEIDIDANTSIYTEDAQNIRPQLVHPRYGKLWLARVDGFTKDGTGVYALSKECKTKTEAIRDAAIKCAKLGAVYYLSLTYVKHQVISLQPPHTH